MSPFEARATNYLFPHEESNLLLQLFTDVTERSAQRLS
jgi:hypothetical protein